MSFEHYLSILIIVEFALKLYYVSDDCFRIRLLRYSHVAEAGHSFRQCVHIQKLSTMLSNALLALYAVFKTFRFLRRASSATPSSKREKH
mmetsp:Transcript_1709/g.3021  ORF Transcript_1709/g.3021 Transcript_1709/m.3021 type:complete len:90 (-) Transcript_1709:781-1050(-)